MPFRFVVLSLLWLPSLVHLALRLLQPACAHSLASYLACDTHCHRGQRAAGSGQRAAGAGKGRGQQG